MIAELGSERFGVRSKRILTTYEGDIGFHPGVVIVYMKRIESIWFEHSQDIDTLISTHSIKIVDVGRRMILPGFIEVGCDVSTERELGLRAQSALYSVEGITTVANNIAGQYPIPMALQSLHNSAGVLQSQLQGSKLLANLGVLISVNLQELLAVENPENIIRQFVSGGCIGFSASLNDFQRASSGSKSTDESLVRVLELMKQHNLLLVLCLSKVRHRLNTFGMESILSKIANDVSRDASILDAVQQTTTSNRFYSDSSDGDDSSRSSTGRLSCASAQNLESPNPTSSRYKRQIRSCEANDAQKASGRRQGRKRSTSVNIREWRLDLDESCNDNNSNSATVASSAYESESSGGSSVAHPRRPKSNSLDVFYDTSYQETTSSSFQRTPPSGGFQSFGKHRKSAFMYVRPPTKTPATDDSTLSVKSEVTASKGSRGGEAAEQNSKAPFGAFATTGKVKATLPTTYMAPTHNLESLRQGGSRMGPVKTVRTVKDTVTVVNDVQKFVQQCDYMPNTLIMVPDEDGSLKSACHQHDMSPIITYPATFVENPISQIWNFARSQKLPFAELLSKHLRSASVSLQMHQCKGELSPGMDADFVVFEAEEDQPVSQVTDTYCGGVRVFHRTSYQDVEIEIQGGEFISRIAPNEVTDCTA